MRQKKLLIIVILFLVIVTWAHAQTGSDKVVKMDGTTIEAILTDISPTEIKYKKASYPNGPTYTLPIKDIKKVILATGEEEVYNVVEDKPVTKADKPSDATPFSADKFLVYSEDGQSIFTDVVFPDDYRYLCVWNLNLELLKKIKIAKYWSLYAQQIADNGNYLDQSIYHGGDGAELMKFKRKELGFFTEYSGWDYPAIVSPSGKRFLINEHGDTREFFFLFNEKGTFMDKYAANNIEGFQFAHKNDMFYILRLNMSGFLIDTYDSEGKEIGTLKVKMIWNNVGFFLKDRVFPQFSFDDNYIISRHTDTDVVVADIKGSVIRHLYQPMANAMTFSRDGKKMATAGQIYMGNTQKLVDENGNKVDYSGGSIKIWSFEGQLIKEINFPAKVQYLQFTPDNKALAVLIGDTGACVWLWEKDDYKLPDGFEKTVEEIAKYQAQKRDEKIRDKRLDFWVDMTVNTYNTLVEGNAKFKASQARLAGEQKKAYAVVDAINNRNIAASKAKCLYKVAWSWNDSEFSISNIHTIPAPPPGAGPTVYLGNQNAYVSEQRVKVEERKADLIRQYDGNGYSIKPINVGDACSPASGNSSNSSKTELSKSKCLYEVSWSWNDEELSISNIHTIAPPPPGAGPTVYLGKQNGYVSDDRTKVKEKKDDIIKQYESNGYSIKPVSVGDSCKN